MSKPTFSYRLFCDTCDREITGSIPQSQVVITDLKQQHTALHQREERKG